MPNKSQRPVDRTKRNPRDPSPERAKSSQSTDERFDESDGAVDAEMEFDTEKYERATPKDR